jgi:hypothetical protein
MTSNCIFRITFPDDRLHLRQWIETFHDFKESQVRIVNESKTVYLCSKFGTKENIKLVALVAFLPSAHRFWYCRDPTYEFWIDHNKWLENLKHARKNNSIQTLTCFSPSELVVSSELLSTDKEVKKTKGHTGGPCTIPISNVSQEGVASLGIPRLFREQMLDYDAHNFTSVTLPTKILKSVCLRLGPIKSLDDEHPNLFHEVSLDLTPSCLIISTVSNYRGDGKIEIYAQEEKDKDKVIIEFMEHHPRRFVQNHLLYSLFLFCKNQHPVSDYITIAFEPGKTLGLYAQMPKKAYKFFHLFPLSRQEL